MDSPQMALQMYRNEKCGLLDNAELKEIDQSMENLLTAAKKLRKRTINKLH